jgi:hypothetical protein
MNIREELNKVAVERGFGTDDNTIGEMLMEEKHIKEFGHDEHRWYTTFWAVVNIANMFLKFQTYRNSGDEPALDNKEHMQMILKSVKQVFPKEVITIDYVEVK